jgi:hypothetical protein
MQYNIKKLILHGSTLISLSAYGQLYAGWQEHFTVGNVLTILSIITPLTLKIYDEAKKDPHQEERFTLLTKQQILLNKQDLDKGDQRIEENKLFLQKKELEIEKERYQNKAYKLELQATSCEKYVDALRRLAEIVPLASSDKRVDLQGKIDKEVESLIRNRCGLFESDVF